MRFINQGVPIGVGGAYSQSSIATLRASSAELHDLSQRFLRRFFFMTELADVRLAVQCSVLARGMAYDSVFIMGPGARSVLPGIFARSRKKVPLTLDIEDYTILESNPFLGRFGA